MEAVPGSLARGQRAVDNVMRANPGGPNLPRVLVALEGRRLGLWIVTSRDRPNQRDDLISDYSALTRGPAVAKEFDTCADLASGSAPTFDPPFADRVLCRKIFCDISMIFPI